MFESYYLTITVYINCQEVCVFHAEKHSFAFSRKIMKDVLLELVKVIEKSMIKEKTTQKMQSYMIYGYLMVLNICAEVPYIFAR